MKGFLWCQFLLAVMAVGFAGCGGGGEFSEGMPQDTTYKPFVMPDAMKGRNMAPKVIPKAGTPGTGASAPAAK